MNLAILPSKPSKVILFKASMSFILRNCTHQSLCPALAWKKPAPFINSFTEFQNATFSWEEIFHPETLKILRNKSRFHILETYSSYYGLCFTMQKLYQEKVSDYSFTMAVNGSLDYNYYLHNPYENEYLLMSVYPYEGNGILTHFEFNF